MLDLDGQRVVLVVNTNTNTNTNATVDTVELFTGIAGSATFARVPGVDRPGVIHLAEQPAIFPASR